MRRTTSQIGLAVVIIGAILIPLSRTPAQTMDYLWQSSVNFYEGQPMVFSVTFELPHSYRFEVYEVNWTGTHAIAVQNTSDQSAISSALASPPWVWIVGPTGYGNSSGTMTVFFDAGVYGDLSHPALAQQGTYVTIYESVEILGTPYDYLLYDGVSLSIIGAAITALGIILSSPKDREQKTDREMQGSKPA